MPVGYKLCIIKCKAKQAELTCPATECSWAFEKKPKTFSEKGDEGFCLLLLHHLWCRLGKKCNLAFTHI